MQSAIMAGEIKDSLLLDAISHSLGIEGKGGILTKILEINTTIPIKRSEVFTTQLDHQDRVLIHIVEGESDRIGETTTLGLIEFRDLPAAPHGVAQLEVSFDVDANFSLHIVVKDLATSKEQGLLVTRETAAKAQVFSWPANREQLVPVPIPPNPIPPPRPATADT
jgi:molecular chaperone DnaK